MHRPFWIFSHLFVATAVALFALAAFWQVARWNERKAENVTIAERSSQEAITIAEALERPVEDLNYVPIADTGRYVEANLIRVANRSFEGQAGDWMVGLYETSEGQLILVNRGFVPREAPTRDEPADSAIRGWLRLSHQLERFGVADDGKSERVPRLDVEAISKRLGKPLAPVWIQQEDPQASSFPVPIPLPALDNGPHLGYAVQWAFFTVLTPIAYVLVLGKKAQDQSDLEHESA